MNKKHNKEIIRLLANMENNYPPDDLIITYADYLRYGQNLPYYKYNPTVLECLTDLTIKLWESPKRIARLDLLTTIKQYTSVAHAEAEHSDSHFKKNLISMIYLQIELKPIYFQYLNGYIAASVI